MGINGWQQGESIVTDTDMFYNKMNRYDDIQYLEKTIEKIGRAHV